MGFKYIPPEKRGYKHLDLPKKIKEVGRIKPKWNIKLDFYLKDNRLMIVETTSKLAKLALIIIFPINLLIFPLISSTLSIVDILEEYSKLFNEKKYGKHSVVYINLENLDEEKAKKIKSFK